jgi:hypothetical protein
MPFDHRDPAAIRTLSRNRCFLYVAPCVYEDMLKLGFSRDPLQRFESLHRRWFEFFDIDRIALVETETVRDARALELALKRELTELNTNVPLTVAREAGGHGEWYRGASPALASSLKMLEEEGYRVHVPARDWLYNSLLRRRELLYSWCDALLPADEPALETSSMDARRAVQDALDAFAAFDIALEDWLPPEVLRWYRSTGRR